MKKSSVSQSNTPHLPLNVESFDDLLNEFIASETEKLGDTADTDDAADTDTADPEDDGKDDDGKFDLDAAIDSFFENVFREAEEARRAENDEPFLGDEVGEVEDKGTDEEEEPVEPDVPLLKSMDFLVGLDNVKNKLSEYEKMVRFNSWRLRLHLPSVTAPLHAMFLGSPGTGKTTVAKMMGVMLRRAGLLSRGHVVVRERSTLLGPNYSDEQTLTLKALDEAEGGILFIDEAYQLYQPADPRDPGHFVLDTLLSALSDELRRDWMLIMAGYTKEMRRMFDMNPGLASRFPENNIYVFEDLNMPQLMEVARRYLADNEYTLSPEACQALCRRISADYDMRTSSFGNARYVRNLIQTEIIPAMAMRVVNSGVCDSSALTLILPEDIPAPIATPQGVCRPMGFVA